MAYTMQWLEGTRAYADLVEKQDNPYKYMSDAYLAWADGWDDAAILADPSNASIGKLEQKKEAA